MDLHFKAPDSGLQGGGIPGVFLLLLVLSFPGLAHSQSVTAADSLNSRAFTSDLPRDGTSPIGAMETLKATRPGESDLQARASEAFDNQLSGLQKHRGTAGNQKKKAGQSPSAISGSPGHIFWVIPAFKVTYGERFHPLTPKEKFEEWAQGAYDPLGLTVGATEAGTIEYSPVDGFGGYGNGWKGYGECFGALELDANVSSFIGDFALTTLFHQDPRYFRLGEGSFVRRVWYAVSRVFVTYSDTGHTVFYTSALSGTIIAAGVSNLYYPSQEVGFGHTLSRVEIDLGNTALYNLAAEFWPDIDGGFRHLF